MDTIAHTLDIGERLLSISVPGDILSTNVENLRIAAFALLDDPGVAQGAIRVVEVDLRRASMVDSMGLNLLVSIIRAAKKIGASVRLVVSNNNVMRTLQFTRFHAHAEIRRVQAD